MPDIPESVKDSKEFVYIPSEEQIRYSNLFRLAIKNNIGTVEELYNEADRDQEWFWNSVVEDCNIEFFEPYKTVLDTSEGVQWPKWFKEGKINISYNNVERFSSSDSVAIRFERENGESGDITFSELDRITGRLSGSLLKLGVAKGDRVGIYMPLSPESVIAMYSIMRIGAVAVPMFSGYGLKAVETRVEDAGIRVVFTTYSYQRKGREIRMIDTVRQIGNVSRIVHGLEEPESNEYDFYSLVEDGEYTKTVQTSSEDPAIMLYTSGTTGKPKGTVHVHGGSLVNIAKEVKYYMDYHDGDVLYWITDLGWMMGPWAIIGANALRGTIFLYDGAIDYPDEKRLWKMIGKNHITLLGVSPTFIRTLKFRGIKDEMSGIRVFGSTGEPWDYEGWMWLFENFGGGRTPIANISGGTDIIGCFLGSSPAIPLTPRCLYRGLGMNVSVYDDSGNDVYNTVGYLVSKKPFPSMTRGIWGRDEKYIETYWSRYGDAWFQGDWAQMDEDGYFYLFGRADEVIKVAGKRTGPNEIENVAMKVEGVKECAVAGIPDEIKGEAVAVFYLGDDSDTVRMAIKKKVEQDLGKSFSPKAVINLPSLPKTKNGKIMRRVIRKVFLDEDPGDISNIEDTAILDIVREAGRKHRTGA